MRIMPGVATKSTDPGANVGIYSFGEKGNTRPKAQYEFDVRFLRDPSGQVQFKNLNGTEPDVRAWVSSDPRLAGIIAACRMVAEDLLRARESASGQPVITPLSNWVSFSFKDIHGRWISPAIAELVADALDKDGYIVTVNHYGIGGNVIDSPGRS